MNSYGAKDLARQFRVVRANTIKIAEEIDEKNYSFQPTKETRTVAQLLAHIAVGARFNMKLHGDKATTLAGLDFGSIMGELRAAEQKPRTKAELVALLKEEGDKFAAFLEPLSDSFLGEMVGHAPGRRCAEIALRNADGGEGAGNAPSRPTDAHHAITRHGAAVYTGSAGTHGGYGRGHRTKVERKMKSGAFLERP